MQKLRFHITKILKYSYPQSLIIKSPILGAFIYLLFLLLFVVVYKPLHIHGSSGFPFYITMFFYGTISAIVLLLVASVLKRINSLMRNPLWTAAKELLSVAAILSSIGVSIYFAGFVFEDPHGRWSLNTFADSFLRAVLIGFIPVAFPTIWNIRYALTPPIHQSYGVPQPEDQLANAETAISIRTKTRKDELRFLPSEFVYAESRANYVVFHMQKDGNSQIVLRASLNEVELQLSEYKHILRIHRAFIVNLNHVVSKSGNALGYQLKLQGQTQLIPVSRQNTQRFDSAMQSLRLSVHP